MDDFIPDDQPDQTGAPGDDFAPDDNQPPAPPPPTSYWQDVRSNASKAFKEDLPRMGQSMFNQAKRIAPGLSPDAALRSGFQRASGTPWQETDIGRSAIGLGQAGKGMAEGLWQGVKDTAKIPFAAYETGVEGKPLSQTRMGQSFRERPVGYPVGVAATVFPLAKLGRAAGNLAEASFAGPEANALESVGARGMNRAAGITPSTLEEMTPKRPANILDKNPERTNTRLGVKLAEEGTTGFRVGESLDKALGKHTEFGKGVSKAIADIKGNNPYEWDNSYNMLHTDANASLKPLLEQAAKLEGSKYPEDALAGKWYRAAYDSLAEKANSNNGFLTFDHVHDELQHLGDVIGRTSDANLKIVKRVYGKIADLSDKMVQEVADSAGRPELRDALKRANEGYSRYSRILPDMTTQSAKSSMVRASSFLKNPWDRTVDAFDPQISKGIYKAGKLARKAAPIFNKVASAPDEAITGIANKVRGLKGDERGSIFPERKYLSDEEVLKGATTFRTALRDKNGKVHVGDLGEPHREVLYGLGGNKNPNAFETGFYDTVTKKFLTGEELADNLGLKQNYGVNEITGDDLENMHMRAPEESFSKAAKPSASESGSEVPFRNLKPGDQVKVMGQTHTILANDNTDSFNPRFTLKNDRTGEVLRRVEKTDLQPTGEQSGMPEVAPGSKTGEAHALYAYDDDFGPNGTKRKIYNVFGDPNDPKVKAVGHGSSVPEDVLQKHGIKIVGKEKRNLFKKPK